MPRPSIKEDLKFVKTETHKGVKFVQGYFKEKAADKKKDRIVKMLEYGPFDGLRLLLVIIITTWISVSLELFRADVWPIIVIIFFFFHGVIFAREWVGSLWSGTREMGGGLFAGMITLGQELVVGLFNLAKEIIEGAWNMVLDIIGVKR